MDEALHQIISAMKLAIILGGSGAIFAMGTVWVCRALKWAPVNITVTVNTSNPVEIFEDAIRKAK